MKIYFIPEKVRVLIFDVDSTLYTNPEYANEQIDGQIRHFAQIRKISTEEARRLFSDFRKNWAQTHSGQKISLGISIEERILWRKKLINPSEFLKPDARLFKTLSDLKEKFYLICVTNNPVLTARKTLEALGISGLIPEIIGLDTTLKSKPAREIFELAAKTAGTALNTKIKFEECISIGDRYDIDLDLPLKLGMGAILVDGVKDVYLLPEVL